jgi:hypothetical protein
MERKERFLGSLLTYSRNSYWVSEEIPGIESFVLLVMGFVFSPLKAPHCAFCTFWCDLLFGLWFILFSSLVPLLDAFSLFIYLINFEKTNRKMKCTNWSTSQLYYGMVKSMPLKLGNDLCNPIMTSELGNKPNKMDKVVTIP